MSKLISIIIPVYNIEKYLKKCIESIINQTYKNLEIILVDDGSSDNSRKICDEYAKKDGRIIVIHKENGGLSDARNVGLDFANGEYIGFVDGDDYIACNMYEMLYSAIESQNADMSLCNFLYVDEQGNMINDMNTDSPIHDEVLSGIDILSINMIEKNGHYWVVAWNKLYKKSLFNDIKYPIGKLHEDEFIIHKLLYKCKSVSCVSNPLYFYLQRVGSIMHEKYSIKRLDAAEAYLDRVEFMLKNQITEGVFKYYSHAQGHLSKGYMELDYKHTPVRNKIKELRKRFIESYVKIPKKNCNLKAIISIWGIIICPVLYHKFLKLRMKLKNMVFRDTIL